MPLLGSEVKHYMKRTAKNSVTGNVIKIALSALLASIVLAACASLIPDQEATDPFGLDGQKVFIPFDGPALALAPLAVPGSAEGRFTIDDFEEKLPVNPTLISNQLRVASASLDDSAGPAELTLRNVVVNLRIWEGSGEFSNASRKTSVTLTSDATLTLAKGACNIGSCDYTVSSGNDLGALELRGKELAAFLDIMTSGARTNNIEVSISLVGSPDELAGQVLTITLGAKEGRISFK